MHAKRSTKIGQINQPYRHTRESKTVENVKHYFKKFERG